MEDNSFQGARLVGKSLIGPISKKIKYCPNCGKEIIPGTVGKPKKFCSYECRTRFNADKRWKRLRDDPEYKARQNAKSREWRLAHPERFKMKVLKWKAEHPERWKEIQLKSRMKQRGII